MKKRIVIEIRRWAKVYTFERFARMDMTDLLGRQKHPVKPIGHKFDLQPFFFAKTRKKVIVFQSPYDSRLEEIEIEGESVRLFEEHPIHFHPDGWPILMSRHEITQPDKHQLLLPLKPYPANTLSE